MAFDLTPAGTPDLASQPVDSIRWALVDIDRYEVTRAGSTVGFIDVVGSIYVVLAGARADQATELNQTLVFEHAVYSLQLLNSAPSDIAPHA